MSIGKANCLVCGKPLQYWEEARPVTCHICGKEEMGHCVCEVRGRALRVRQLPPHGGRRKEECPYYPVV